MRYGIFSDIHSNLEALEAVVAAYKKESIDAYLCVGDIVGYAANPNECSRITASLAQNCVAGNHDWASLDKFPVEYFNPAAAKAIHWTKERLSQNSVSYLSSLKLVYKNDDLTLAHATLKEPQEFDYLTGCLAAEGSFRLLTNRICFVGHTHLPAILIQDKKGSSRQGAGLECRIEEGSRYIINVGSVGQPRDGDPRAAYCVYDTLAKEVSIKRAGYDAGSARDKIIGAGLPPFLGERLLEGR